MSDRVIAYIDGFNLYFGLKTKGWKRFYWLDLGLLAANLLKPGQHLSAVRYFTARISGPPDKQRRQNVFLEANAALGRCRMHFGQYQEEPYQCRKCGATHMVHHEKMTDVNIAVHLFEDALLNAFDTALLVSADSDLVPPVAKVRELFPRQRVVVAFSAGRFSKELAAVAHGYLKIGRSKYEKSLLPAEVTKPDGVVLRPPTSWR